MKYNDIFERVFEGQIIRFRLVALKPYLIAIITMDITPPLFRSGNTLLTSQPQAALAKYVDGKYVTTAVGDRWVNRFTVDIYNRITARSKSLNWLIERMGMEQSEAKALIEKLDKEFNHWEVRYLPAIVRWAYNGEIDPESEYDINRVKSILLTYFTYLADRKKDGCVRIKYDSPYFKRMIEGQPGTSFKTMDEMEEALRPWADKIIRFNRWPGDKETKVCKDGG
jgi:hypothetical protein